MKAGFYLLSLLLSAVATSLFAETTTVFVTREYSFDYAQHPEAPDIAQSLCGTRCNAISGSFDSYMMPGGWRLVKTNDQKKIVLDIAAPFIEGNCICIGEEYEVTRDIPLPGATSR